MSQIIHDSTVQKGLTASYGSSSISLSSLISNPSLSIYCDKQSEEVSKCVSLLNDNDVDKEMILLNNHWFSEEYRKLVSEEVVAVRRMAKLNRLEQIAVENRVYVEKMRKRFVHSNIVGVDNTLNELNSLTSIESNMDSDRYDYSDDDYSEYESEGSEFGESSEEYSDDYSDDYSNKYSTGSAYSLTCEDYSSNCEEYSNLEEYSSALDEYSTSTGSSSSVYSEEDWNKEDRVIEVGHLLKL
ncbi:hypothetical protein WA171_007141 [Blastocystis sp. BT1]